MASRYRRVNIDGQSLHKTETRIAKSDIQPGTLAVINAANQFEQTSTIKGRVYVIDVAYQQGLNIREAVPAGDSAIGNYVEEGRELAVLCTPGTYKKDTPITVAGGLFKIASSDTDSVIGYSQDEAVIAAGALDFIRVRFRVGTVAAASA